MDKQSTIRVTEQELYELCSQSIRRSTMTDPVMFNSRLKHEVSKSFRLLSSMEKTSADWFHKRATGFLLIAGVSFFALVIKIFCESFWRIH